MNIDLTTVKRTNPGRAQTRRNMTNKASQLGRSIPSEKLTREEVAALDRATRTPETPAKPPENGGSGLKLKVRMDMLRFRWSLECPGCGFKVNGDGQPQLGNRLARCGRCKVVLVLGGG